MQPSFSGRQLAMSEIIHTGDRVEIYLGGEAWKNQGWFSGSVVRIDPYSTHRSFYWVELDQAVTSAQGGRIEFISVFNIKHIRKLEPLLP